MDMLLSTKLERISSVCVSIKKDFGVTAEWHYYAKSHGKGLCVGVDGRVKWLAACLSLQQLYGLQIKTFF